MWYKPARREDAARSAAMFGMSPPGGEQLRTLKAELLLTSQDEKGLLSGRV